MKRKILIIIFNIIVIVLVFIIADFLCFSVFSNNNFSFSRYLKSIDLITFDEYVSTWEFRDFINEKSKKRPILIFGCSFAYGDRLDKEQSLSAKLAQKTGRSVYNRAVSSTGIQYFLYMLQHYNIEKEVQNPEYILYIMIDHHLFRLYRPYWGYTEPVVEIRYKNVNNELKEYVNPFYKLGKSTIYRTLSYRYNDYIFWHTSDDEKFDFMKLYYETIKSIINKKFPYSKVIILRYEENPESYIFNTKRWLELGNDNINNSGFIITDTYSLTDRRLSDVEYKIPNDVHPNEKAIELLSDKLIEKFAL